MESCEKQNWSCALQRAAMNQLWRQIQMAHIGPRWSMCVTSVQYTVDPSHHYCFRVVSKAQGCKRVLQARAADGFVEQELWDGKFPCWSDCPLLCIMRTGFFPAIFRCWAAEMRRLLRRSNCFLFAERLRFPASAPCWSIWQTYIHPASRGVAAHTAGLFRSVRGAKGGFPRGSSSS